MINCTGCGGGAWKATKVERLEDKFELDRETWTFEPTVGADSIVWRFVCAGCGSVASRNVGRQLYEWVAPASRVFRDERDDAWGSDPIEGYDDPTILEA